MEPKNLHSDKFSGDARERVLRTTGLEADASLHSLFHRARPVMDAWVQLLRDERYQRL